MPRITHLVLAVFLLGAGTLSAQTDTMFWFAAPEVSAGHGDAPIFLRMTSIGFPADVTVSMPTNPAFPIQQITIPANTQQSIELTPWKDLLEHNPPNQILPKGLLITSSYPISAFYEVSRINNPDIFVLKGNVALGQQFLIPFQTYLNNGAGYSIAPYASFDIVATEDSTRVTIIPSRPIVGHPANTPFTIVLNRGQSYSARASSQAVNQRPAGSSVVSNKPIAITIKDDSMAGAPFGGCADLGGDQLVPITQLGTEYIAINGFLNGPGDQLFIMATEDSTEVFRNGVSAGIINAGQTLQLSVGNPSVYVQTSLPASALQLSGYGCEVGISILPQIRCSGSDQVYITRSTNEPFFINLLVPAGAETGFRFNGNPTVLPASAFQPIPGTNGEWLAARTNISLADFPTGSVAVVSNALSFFHLGAIHGGPGTGTRFGYFSNYESIKKTSVYASICRGETYEGYTEPGTYVQEFVTEEGCDSLHIIYLSLLPDRSPQCPCASTVGTLNNSPLSLCMSDCATPAYDSTAQFLDANDRLQFVLHRDSSSLADILARSHTGTFCFDPDSGMQPGITYYITAVVGEADSSGMVNLADTCTRRSAPTPLSWYPFPEGNLSIPATICRGDSATIQLQLSGIGPFTLHWQIDGQDTIITEVGHTLSWSILPTQSVSYVLQSITDAFSGCRTELGESRFLRVNIPVRAGIPLPTPAFCQGSELQLSLSTLLTNPSAGGSWQETTPVPSLGFIPATGLLNVPDLPPGLFSFRYGVEGEAPCPSDTATVFVRIHPNPIADAGPDQALSCWQREVRLGSLATATGPNLVYRWTNVGGTVLGNDVFLSVPLSGNYNLAVLDSVTGCRAIDEVVVLDTTVFPVLLATTEGNRCFGYSDGLLRVDTVWGGTPAYQFSLNGGPFTGQQVYANLLPGVYTLVVRDARGCRDTLMSNVAAAALLQVSLMASEARIFAGDTVWLSFTSSPPLALLDSVRWIPAPAEPCQPCAELRVVPRESTVYAVRISAQGCWASASVAVEVDNDRGVYVPNAFTPNGDGSNDVWVLYASRNVSKIRQVTVYSRWGEKVWEAFDFPPNEPAFGWDGRLDGLVLNPAVFVYVAEIEWRNGATEIIKGDVSLLR